jgi:nanoRNase/pAp phosphatase (c-di-AMP/oligoRNAs hydrolase)
MVLNKKRAGSSRVSSKKKGLLRKVSLKKNASNKRVFVKKNSLKKKVVLRQTPDNIFSKGVDRSLFVTSLKKIDDFLSLDLLKRVAIVSDNDQDGLTAAVQMKLFFDSKKIESKVFFYDHYTKMFSLPKDYFFEFNPEKTIFLDLNEGFVATILDTIGTKAGPCLIIDHHQSSLITNSPFRMVTVKPHSFSSVEASRYPASKMVHDLFKGKDWVCAIGVIGDFAHEQWSDFLDSVSKKYDFSRKKLIELDEIVGCITSQYPEKINSLFEFLCKAKNPNELLKSEYVVFKNLFLARLKILKDDFYKDAEYYPDSELYFFRSDNRFSGKLSNDVSKENPAKVVIIFEQPEGKIKCSIRRQDFRVNCGELAKAGVKDIPDSNGGGHIPAAGAAFPSEYLEQFKKQVRIYLLNNPPKEVLTSTKQ